MRNTNIIFYTTNILNFYFEMKLLTIQTFRNRKFNVLTIFPSFTKLYFGLSEREGFILDLCESVHGLSKAIPRSCHGCLTVVLFWLYIGEFTVVSRVFHRCFTKWNSYFVHLSFFMLSIRSKHYVFKVTQSNEGRPFELQKRNWRRGGPC